MREYNSAYGPFSQPGSGKNSHLLGIFSLAKMNPSPHLQIILKQVVARTEKDNILFLFRTVYD